MSEHAQTETEVDPESGETLRVPSVESRSQVHSDDGEPVSDEMASSAAVAAGVAIRQGARAYAANQAAAYDVIETKKNYSADFSAPRREVRRRLPPTWTQPMRRSRSAGHTESCA